jgi:hypothetical protein
MYRPTEQIVERRLVAQKRLLAVVRGDLGINTLEGTFWSLNRRYGANLDKIGYNFGVTVTQREYTRLAGIVAMKLEYHEQMADPTYCGESL